MNGIINVYKEQGFTSFDVIAKLRGILHFKKLGHTGTLDPMAEGVLPVCVGSATKVCSLLTDKDKEYIAEFKLGIQTDTQDITGECLNSSEINVSEIDVRTCISSFVGTINQLTPMYSARKVNGKKLYEYAREGIEVERKTKSVRIYYIDVLDINLLDNIIKIKVGCEKGTYIRTLINDIGEKLGCYATMTSLLRTKVDIFTLENALKLSDIDMLVKSGRTDVCLIETDTLFLQYPKVIINEELLKYVLNGNKLRNDNFDFEINEGDCFRFYDKNNKFLAIYKAYGDELKNEAMFV